jgi:peptidoglycan/xylan/chitin deacetylase (PgdA/CDA1 family)
MSGARDLRGYCGQPPAVRWPGDARVAVSLVVNFEEGGEFTVSAGDARNEGVYEVVDEKRGAVDLGIESHFEYGTRAGYWRIADVLDAFGAKATFSACGRAVEAAPWIARDAFARGHEIAAHGYRWATHLGMSEAEERESIARCVAAIESATGRRPVGWHTRAPATPSTRRLLVEHGGFLYDSDAYNDDLPYVVAVGGKRHLVLPYAFDTNDMHFQHTQRFAGAADFAAYCTDAFDWLSREGERAPRMLSIGLHLRMIGRPGRIAALERILAHVTGKRGAWIARREDIARHWIENAA